jgi:hypothetical protein
MTKALFIPATGEPRTIILPKENAHKTIHELIGGWFDCVSLSDEVVMYVHDEGLLIGLDPNVTASTLYGNPIAGDVLLVGTLNAQGERDGYDYDLPEFMFEPTFVARVNEVNSNPIHREIISLYMAQMDLTPRITTLTDDEFNEWLGAK